ncbi:hypothetical protein FRB94_005262 [Tulasnella sp. JGI-2019a]|nr:hypothetical protein FRB94_005262 [Tulasnella sp. JGI-2019a]KAG9016202.1 hypothetical protein FRB93_011676 [Tulasnella sp. JGI-2019a]KAG9036487.1 hypothetical protein FRB95_008785 [Tulasnella sp. JGI-2019a]
MHLARHSITSTTPVNVIDVRFNADCELFAAATPSGFGVYKTWPLKLLRKRDLTGTVSKILPLHKTNIIFLVGGGRNPSYPPNKVIFWDESIGREVVELEFKEQVRGLACRRGTLVVALKRRIVVFDVSNDKKVARIGEWETCENEKGLLALASAPDATLLIAPGRQVGHVQLIHLPPCPPPPLPSPPPDGLPSSSTAVPQRPTKYPVSIIVAHTTSLTTLSLPPSGRLISTTSSRGTLIRVWNATTGKLLKELRRGSDSAVIYGVAFRQDETELCVWSDKGTIHVFKISDKEGGTNNRQSTFSPLSGYLHKYFSSQWSYAQYRLPSTSTHISLHSATPNNSRPDPRHTEEEKCTVGWIEVPVVVTPAPAITTPQSPQSAKASGARVITPQPLRQTQVDYQLVALTFSGCWYRLSVPSSLSTSSVNAVGSSSPVRRASSASSFTATEKGKGKAKRKDGSEAGDTDDERPERECSLIEFKRFGRWDGWG